MMETTTLQVKGWTPLQKTIFRFSVIFFILVIFPFPFNSVPGIAEVLAKYYDELWLVPVQLVGKHVFNIDYKITVLPNGSGDTTFNYVQLFIFTLLSIIVSGIWSLIDKRQSYNKFLYWSTVIVRYYLAFIMLSYGINKLFKLQFPFPGLISLEQPLGYSSPMGLAWNFMGYSYPYTFFGGLLEVLGGLLLFFRRTTLLGAVIIIVVMLNVAMMNFSFDIPVKIYSTLLLLMSFFIIVPDLKRLSYFFFLNKAVPAKELKTPFSSQKLLYYQKFVKPVVIFLVIGFTFYESWQMMIEYGDDAPRPPLYGIYDVETFIQNNDTIPPLTTDSTRWKKMIVPEYSGFATIKFMNDREEWFAFEPDTVSRKVTLYAYEDTTEKYVLDYELSSGDKMVLKGSIMDKPVKIRFKKFDIKKFTLVNRGFNWINEYPYNR